MSLPDSIRDFLASYMVEFVIVVIGSVLASLILYPLLRNLEKPKFSFETVQDVDKLGFRISVKKRMIKDCRVRCNNINYSWEDGDKKIERKDLYVGDTPSVFFPYQLSWSYVKEIPHPSRANRVINKKPSDVGVLFTIKELSTKNILFKEYFLMRNDRFMMIPEYKKECTFNASIRVIGEGVEEVKDYSVKIGLKDLGYPEIKEGKFTSDQIWVTFELKKKHFLW